MIHGAHERVNIVAYELVNTWLAYICMRHEFQSQADIVLSQDRF